MGYLNGMLSFVDGVKKLNSQMQVLDDALALLENDLRRSGVFDFEQVVQKLATVTNDVKDYRTILEKIECTMAKLSDIRNKPERSEVSRMIKQMQDEISKEYGSLRQ